MEKVLVKNRSAAMVFYKVPDMGIKREFLPNEVKDVTKEELVKLSYADGGQYIIDNFLQILTKDEEDKEFVEEILSDLQPEYNYSEEDIKKLCLEGSLDEFLDFLDFAPEGGLDLLKKVAVELPIKNIDKIDAIYDKLGFSVSKALENLKNEDGEVPEKTNAPTRRTKGLEVTSATTDKPKYTIINK